MSTAAPEAPARTVPFEFFDTHVVRTRRLGPTMLRITFGGEALRHFTSGGRDQRFKLFLPHPGQDAPVVPTDAGDAWFTVWRSMDPSVRGIMRSYTVREQRRFPQHELDIDFALHGVGDPADAAAAGFVPAGPASRWAATARPGDRVTILGPTVDDNGGVDFRPAPGTDWVLISGDETALPAVAGILEWLPAGTPAKVWLEVPHAEDIQTLPTAADADITWLVRDNTTDPRTDFHLASVASAQLPDGTPYAWIAGEAGTVKALRRHLVGERGFDRKRVKFTGYWRMDTTEEQLVEEAVAAAAGATSE
ncbi:sialic acid transporter [Streptomyces abyssalis]|uniref:Sialic acid transporter n=1 Tax=Streptomyces abyssalis TaxID=933944 RepID=A0A1E7JV80_9ACTN|nr:siderophore-interacting protein [Streptomyces abyssalis]OEU89251.1 sialic acid transporter [Streptomyces abyssalis]OEU93865.1 sialic acid transporter [Streptomyces abyssalis]OEV28038.1 sialic acid transporter [Streptomyces nanshensis]